jgi:hypothetical protein
MEFSTKGYRPPHIEQKPIPQIVSEVMEFISQKGHTCGFFNLADNKMSWCQQDECEDVKRYASMEKRQKDAENFAQNLIKKGHKCVYYMDSYPVQIGWCNNDLCTGKI